MSHPMLIGQDPRQTERVSLGVGLPVRDGPYTALHRMTSPLVRQQGRLRVSLLVWDAVRGQAGHMLV